MRHNSNHRVAVLAGQQRDIHDANAGRIHYYFDAPDPDLTNASSANPLLLIHSINAAAGAHEVRPLFDGYKQRRPTYAVDLPGFGQSERSDRPYLPRLMVQALQAMMREIRRRHPGTLVDALAVSLSCEFLARLASETPEGLRSIALVSPTGFRRNTPQQAALESNRGSAVALRILGLPMLGLALFRTLTTAPSVRFFLKKTWGGSRIDEQMFEDSLRSARAPGAHHAPLYFLSGFLFSADIVAVYRSLTLPVWMSHGVRGDFTDYSGAKAFMGCPNWHFQVFQTGALPYFEQTEAFIEAYDAFLRGIETPDDD